MIAILGTGKMGEALLSGLLRAPVLASRRCSAGRIPYSIWYSKLSGARPVRCASDPVIWISRGSWVASMGYPEPFISTRRQRP